MICYSDSYYKIWRSSLDNKEVKTCIAKNINISKINDFYYINDNKISLDISLKHPNIKIGLNRIYNIISSLNIKIGVYNSQIPNKELSYRFYSNTKFHTFNLTEQYLIDKYQIDNPILYMYSINNGEEEVICFLNVSDYCTFKKTQPKKVFKWVIDLLKFKILFVVI